MIIEHFTSSTPSPEQPWYILKAVYSLTRSSPTCQVAGERDAQGQAACHCWIWLMVSGNIFIVSQLYKTPFSISLDLSFIEDCIAVLTPVPLEHINNSVWRIMAKCYYEVCLLIFVGLFLIPLVADIIWVNIYSEVRCSDSIPVDFICSDWLQILSGPRFTERYIAKIQSE
jgi:hypothetical protein